MISVGALMGYSYRKEIKKVKNQLKSKSSFNTAAVSNTLIDKIPEGRADQIFGLDLSHHQKNIDWDKVATNAPHFIIFKTTEGSTHKDTKYDVHHKKARANGILVGGYHFFSYQSPGAKQARHFLKHLKLQKGDLIPVLDVEFQRNMSSDSWIIKNVEDFINVVEKEIEFKPIIYCEIAYYNRYLKAKYADELQLWICDFRSKPRNNFVFWQTTDRYKQPGIRGTVDYNLFNGTDDDLQALLY